MSKMMVEGSNRRIHTVDRHAGLVRLSAACLGKSDTDTQTRTLRFCTRVARAQALTRACQAVAGMAPDGRVLVTRARAEASQYIRRVCPHSARVSPRALSCSCAHAHRPAPRRMRSFYGDRIPAQVLAERLASFIHLYTLYWSVRPFGASILLAVADAPAEGSPAGAPPAGASLYQLDPAGEVYRYRGAAIGKGRAQAKTELERLALGELSCADAVVEIAKIIHRCHDEKDKAFETELSWVCAASGWQHARVPADVAAAAVAAAKAALEAAGMED